jgi:hypothetical protein
MDISEDFIQPEFLNILFFRQKNLVIFPYVDLKHLHGLEIFTAGYNVVDLESTALHNLREILEFEKSNTYSQNPTLFFITNVSQDKIKEIMSLEGIHCVINSNEKSNFRELVNGSSFIFFNKKHNQFLNYELSESELEFEKELIFDSKNEAIFNQNGNLDNVHNILVDYDKKYWNQILEYTGNYFDITLPEVNIDNIASSSKKDFSNEYELCVSSNRQIGKEYIQLLHEYRSKKVNPAHLELEELYNPLKLYNYLRNHHWKEGIPKDFISAWAQMKISGYMLTEQDQTDFNSILTKLEKSSVSLPIEYKQLENKTPTISIELDSIPSLSNEWPEFKDWLLNHINQLEDIIDNFLNTSPDKLINTKLSELTSYLIQEIIGLNELFQGIH